jgi:hypothetical protein
MLRGHNLLDILEDVYAVFDLLVLITKCIVFGNEPTVIDIL